MADNPPAPPANAGFKLKLKLGGGNSSTTVSPAIPSTAAVPKPVSPPEPGISNLPGASAASTSTSLPAGPSAAVNSASAASEDAAPLQASNDSILSSEAHHDAEEGDYEPDEMEEYGGEYATSKKAAAKLQRARKTSTPAANSNLAAASSSSYATAADSADLQATVSSASPLNNASPGPSVSKTHDAAKYETSIGSIVLPASSTSSVGTSRKRKPGEGGGTGLGRGWRKGLKGYQRGDLNSPGPGAARGDVTPGAAGSSAGSSRKRKAHTAAAAAVAAGDESTLDRNLDAEDFVPTMAPPGALATSEKWANGLPGGNEQSRLTASMANAVNRQFPVGPPPKTGSGFLQPQPLDKNTPRPRSWKKVKREIVGPSGIPFTVTIWQGDNESSYADYMAEHPRPPPVDKKAANLLATGLEAGSPAPEGSYPPSDGTPADPMSESGATPGQAGAPAGRGSGRGRGRGSGRGTGARRKPGPPKKKKALPPPIVGPISEAAPAMDNLASTALTAEPSLATSTTSNADTPNVDDATSTFENQPKDASNVEPASVESQDTSMAAAV